MVFKTEVDHYLPKCYTIYLYSSVILQIYVISTTTSHSNQEHSPQPVKEESKDEVHTSWVQTLHCKANGCWCHRTVRLGQSRDMTKFLNYCVNSPVL